MSTFFRILMSTKSYSTADGTSVPFVRPSFFCFLQLYLGTKCVLGFGGLATPAFLFKILEFFCFLRLYGTSTMQHFSEILKVALEVRAMRLFELFIVLRVPR